MRSKRRKPKRSVDPEKVAATENAKKDYEAQIQELADSFEGVRPEQVRDTLHPFEVAGICGDKPLSTVQKAITYCIEHLGGAAAEQEILVFLRRYWSQIIPKSADQHRQVPDKRVLRINFTIQKDKRFLFVRSLEDPAKWCLNTTKAPMEPNRRIMNEIVPFQERMLAILRSHDSGLTFEELVDLTRDFAHIEGLFQNLTHAKRVRGCLASKKAIHEVYFDERTQKWIAGQPKAEKSKKSRSDDYYPGVLKGLHIRDISYNELWNLLKEKGIY
jgi:hypothetical protein